METNYTTIAESRYEGSLGRFAYRIQVDVGTTSASLAEISQIADIYQMDSLLRKTILANHYKHDTDFNNKNKAMKEGLIDLFSGCTIFIEEINNEYSSEPGLSERPWLIVTTPIGRFKIGYRKRVIVIDWSETIGTRMAQDLFEDQDVTMAGKMIHAWSLKDARKYLNTIFNDTYEKGNNNG